ncbi:hypothetical protein BZG21_45380 [Escherichia coli]|nr:hypothetical protein [Escherichia coli]
MNVLVLDDGVGMDQEKLHQLRENRPDEKPFVGGYGIHNVNERLLLHYGPEAQLEMDSRIGGGTRISFSIPFLEERP